MRILLIDTCGSTGSIALADAGPPPAILATSTLPGRTASERLIPAIKELAASAGESLRSIGVIAVVHGPGSFTGLRVGLSAAKGLCEALGVPLVAISRLAVLASLAAPGGSAIAFAVLDAGRGEFYLGEYHGLVCRREGLFTRDEVLAACGHMRVNTGPETRVVCCETVVAEALALLKPLLLAEPAAADALPLALLRVREAAFDDIAAIDANYVRRSDAQIFAKPAAKSALAQPRHTPSA